MHLHYYVIDNGDPVARDHELFLIKSWRADLDDLLWALQDFKISHYPDCYPKAIARFDSRPGLLVAEACGSWDWMWMHFGLDGGWKMPTGPIPRGAKWGDLPADLREALEPWKDFLHRREL